MGVIYEYLTYDGKSSLDYKVHISGSGTYDSPKRDVEAISIPGRNGDLHIDNERFENIDIVYPAYITEDFDSNFVAFKGFLQSKIGYKRLEDSYHQDFYRKAIYLDSLIPNMSARNRAGTFDIKFNCDPRMFLKSGEAYAAMSSGGKIKNPTLFNALPIIKVYGNGTFTIGDISVKISGASRYTYIDCDLQEAYGETMAENRNSLITLNDGKFPYLSPGDNTVTYTGFTSIEIKPNWWTI